MKISFDSKTPKTDALVVFAAAAAKGGVQLLDAAADLDKKTKGALRRAADAAHFDGKAGDILVLPALAGAAQDIVVLQGLGKTADLTALCFEKAGSALLAKLNGAKAASAHVAFPASDLGGKKASADEAAAHFATGMLLNSYRFDKYLTKEPKDKKPTLKSVHIGLSVASAAKAKRLFDAAQKIAGGVFLTRDLVSEAPNVLYPASFAEAIRKNLRPHGVDVQILTRKDLDRLKMGALIAVGQGSAREPRLVTMRYNGAGKGGKTVAFVGKGITFDTGGISLKPGPGMEEMKWDMAGAGVVTGLIKALAARKAKVNVVGVVALAENMPGGNAYRPGDIVTSMSGQTIEVHNTDAEGRLVLSDALWYAQEKFRPTHIVDLATLTGAIIIALGHEYAGCFSNDDDLARDLVAAGKAVDEALWRMPLNDAWDKAIDTPQADMKNISGGRDAGSAVGAHFLRRFIQDGVKWAHLDIAGVAWSNKDRPLSPKGATAFGVRLLERYVADRWEK
jgi:leucyl aminopeptidase